MMTRYDCVTTHTARYSGITNMYLSHKFTIVQIMYISGHKIQKTLMDYIKYPPTKSAQSPTEQKKKHSKNAKAY